MKKNVLIFALKGKSWIGGVYYIKNLLFQLSMSSEAESKYNYYIYADNSVIEEFYELIVTMKIKIIRSSGSQEQLLVICNEYDIDVVLPVIGGGYTWVIRDLCLYWIPDFQEINFPENFSVEDIRKRKLVRDYIAKEHKGLILSSKDSYEDYKTQYPKNTDNVFIVHFVSYISHLVGQITNEFEKGVLHKYGIEYDYIFVANQFWKHKNHIVVLKAMDEIITGKNKKIHLVCTGSMQSYGKKDEYVESLYNYIEEHKLQDYIHFLGLLERKEQLCLMKNARLLIQPSKFEGWGCSVEDAKVMGKGMLLSDISVHKEQQYPKSILFPQDDSIALSKLIIEKFESTEKYDLEYGKQYTKEQAFLYSLELQKAIDAMGGKEKKNYLAELNRRRNEKVLQLFGGFPPNQICILGVDRITEQIIEYCKKILTDVQFVYSDIDEKKWGMRFEDREVYPPSEILRMGVKRIVVCSINDQEAIKQLVKKYRMDIEVVWLYNSDKEKNEELWI